jgi:hypothetical protein
MELFHTLNPAELPFCVHSVYSNISLHLPKRGSFSRLVKNGAFQIDVGSAGVITFAKRFSAHSRNCDKRPLASSCLSVCQFFCLRITSWLPLDGLSWNCNIFWKFVKKNQVSLSSRTLFICSSGKTIARPRLRAARSHPYTLEWRLSAVHTAAVLAIRHKTHNSGPFKKPSLRGGRS